MKKHYRTKKDCLNCGTEVPDKFCPNCGQENLELHEDFLHLMLHSVGHYFHFESKFFNSLVPLFTKPGYLTKEYFAGRRAAHLNPVSMYIFISILFFFLFTANTNINEQDIVEENTTALDAEDQAEAKESINLLQGTIAKRAEAGAMPPELAERTYTILNQSEATLDTGTAHNDAVIFTQPAPVQPDTTEKVAQNGNFELNLGKGSVFGSLQTKAREVFDDDLRSELFKNKLIGHLPKIMFILLPLFALILKLVNRGRSAKFYAEHLVYSIHVHSFLFLFVSFLILLGWLLPFLGVWIKLAGLAVILWYIYRSMRTIYQSSRWRTIYKFCLLSFAYGLLLLVSGLIVVIATLYTV